MNPRDLKGSYPDQNVGSPSVSPGSGTFSATDADLVTRGFYEREGKQSFTSTYNMRHKNAR